MKIRIIDRGMYHAPNRSHSNDCGADIYSTEEVMVKSHRTVRIDLKFGVRVPDGYGMFIFPRSSLASLGICCQHPPIDPGYTGNINAIVSNYSDIDYLIRKGERIGQLVVFPTIICDFVNETNDSERNVNGFGSTGK